MALLQRQSSILNTISHSVLRPKNCGAFESFREILKLNHIRTIDVGNESTPCRAENCRAEKNQDELVLVISSSLWCPRYGVRDTVSEKQCPRNEADRSAEENLPHPHRLIHIASSAIEEFPQYLGRRFSRILGTCLRSRWQLARLAFLRIFDFTRIGILIRCRHSLRIRLFPGQVRIGLQLSVLGLVQHELTRFKR